MAFRLEASGDHWVCAALKLGLGGYVGIGGAADPSVPERSSPVSTSAAR
jgi:hypothetical protein